MSDLDCCEESLSAYLDGELSNNKARIVEIHLQTCVPCKRAFNRMQALSSAVQQIPLPTVNPLLATRILSQLHVRGIYSEIPLITLFKSWGALSLLTLGVIVILFGSVLLGMLHFVFKHLAITTSLVVKLSWQLPIDRTNLTLGLIFIVGAIVAFYGFGRVYSALSREGLIS